MQSLISWMFPPKTKALGPIELGYVQDCARYAQRKHEADLMPMMMFDRKPIEFQTCRWLTGYREMPRVPRNRLGGR